MYGTDSQPRIRLVAFLLSITCLLYLVITLHFFRCGHNTFKMPIAIFFSLTFAFNTEDFLE